MNRQKSNDKKFATKEIFWEEFFGFIEIIIRMEIDSQTEGLARRFKNEYDRVEERIITAISNLKYQVQENNRTTEIAANAMKHAVDIIKTDNKIPIKKAKKK